MPEVFLYLLKHSHALCFRGFCLSFQVMRIDSRILQGYAQRIHMMSCLW